MLYDYADVTPAGITELTEAGIAAAEAEVAAALGGERTYTGTLDPLEGVARTLTEAYSQGAFMARVHPDPEVRDAATRADERISKWMADLVFREDLYRAVEEFSETDEGSALQGERLRLLDHLLRDFRRAGHELAADQRNELQRLKQRLVELEVAFQRNVDEYRDHLELTREELDGLPDDYVEKLPEGQTEGTYRVSLDYPEYFPFMRQARRRDLRRRLEFKMWTSVPANRPLLEEAVQIRHRMAGLFGLESWADYALDVKMAKEPSAVEQFYDELVPGLEKLSAPERAAMAEMLAEDHPGAELRTWDVFYYDNERRKREFGIDPSEIARYFPLQGVIDGMFSITGDVFGLDYRLVDDAKAWHPDVQLYEVIDRDSGEAIAHFYADWFPREGKYTHMAVWRLIAGHSPSDGTRVKPVAALIANFTKPGGDQPALLRHDEVETLFHEFGHILHNCLSTTELIRFSGAETEWDFVEAPSQIMQHWCWQADVLALFARDYETGEPIPAEIVEQLVAARNLNEATFTLRQVFLGRLDMGMHGTEMPIDLEELYRREYDVTGLPVHEDTFPAASFGHLMGGYDAGYYGYLWSKVYGDDMFSVFEAEGTTNPAVGRRYREQILAPGGSSNAAELLRNFLGREPSNEAFLRYLGLE